MFRLRRAVFGGTVNAMTPYRTSVLLASLAASRQSYVNLARAWAYRQPVEQMPRAA